MVSLRLDSRNDKLARCYRLKESQMKGHFLVTFLLLNIFQAVPIYADVTQTLSLPVSGFVSTMVQRY